MENLGRFGGVKEVVEEKISVLESLEKEMVCMFQILIQP